MGTESFDPYHRWLSIPPEEQPPDHYRLLGLRQFESDPEVIRDGADRQMVHVRSYQLGEYSALSQKVLNELAVARVCLLNADKKAAYDKELRRHQGEQTAPLSRAVPVPTTADRVPPIDAESQSHQHAPKRKPPLPILRAVVGAAGVVILGVLVWHLTSADQPPGLKQNPIVVDQPPEAPKPPESPRTVDEPDDSEEPADEEQPKDPPEFASVDPEKAPSSPSTADPPEEPDVPPAEPDEPAQSAPPLASAKLPVPSRDAQDEYRRLLDEAYPPLQHSDAKLRLADVMANLAEEAGDPTEHFVLLRRASELATEGGDAEKAQILVARIAEQFEVNQLLAEAHMLNQIATTARGEEQIGALVRSSAGVLEDAIAAEQFDLANSLSEAVYRATLVSGGQDLRAEALKRRRGVQEQCDLWSKVQAARDVLQQDPDDAEAHTTIAEWYGFVRSDWDRALLHFAKGSDVGLQALANRELENAPQDAAGQVELADAWYEFAATREEQAKSSFLWRAVHWYKRAEPEIVSPLIRAKVGSRLDELARVQRPGSQHAPRLAIAPFGAQQAAQHQNAWSKHLNLPVEIVNSIGMKFVLIPPGEFMMGSSRDEVERLLEEARGQKGAEAYIERIPWETPEHRVRITQPFYLGVHEVTQGSYETVMGANPSAFSRDGHNSDRVSGLDTSRFPVESVSWDDAVEFCRKLSALSAERSAGREYRLPTEAEWEYACRAGTTTPFHFGTVLDGRQANFDGMRPFGTNQKRPSSEGPRAAGGYSANAWDLYDMHGNVWEWCADWFDSSYYANSPVENPMGPILGSGRVYRGGGWHNDARRCRSANRVASGADYRGSAHGFRVFLVPAE